MRRILWVVAVAACGDVKDNSPADAAKDIDMAPGIDAGPCDLSKPFGTPEVLAVASSENSDADAWLSDDQLTVYFRSTRGNGVGMEDIFVARRTSPTAELGTPEPVPGVNSIDFENGVALTADELTIFVGSSRNGTHDVYVSTRSSIAANFNAASIVAGINNGNANDIPVYVNADGTELYFTSNRTGTYKLYVAKRTSATQPFDAPEIAASLSSGDADNTLAITRDGLTAYIGSSRSGGGIFRATRSTPADGFGTAVAVPELSVPGSGTSPSWISPEGCTIALTSDRPGGPGGAADIYLARKPL